MLFNITPEKFQSLLQLAISWTEKQEELILRNGICLNNNQLMDAKYAGVRKPEAIRLLKVPIIPLPDDPSLKEVAIISQLITPHTAGLTLRYGIFIKENFIENRQVLVHEFIHVSQYESLAGFEAFLQQYLWQCITMGYPNAPMEQEAIIGSNWICKGI